MITVERHQDDLLVVRYLRQQQASHALKKIHNYKYDLSTPWKKAQIKNETRLGKREHNKNDLKIKRIVQHNASILGGIKYLPTSFVHLVAIFFISFGSNP